jgi:hypothetical protein
MDECPLRRSEHMLANSDVSHPPVCLALELQNLLRSRWLRDAFLEPPLS